MHVTDLGPLRLKRAAGSITELLAPQQKVLVQIMKEPTGNKGPRLTGNVTLPGRYLVLMPYGKGVNLSRRIQNEHERNRLRALAILLKPAGMGLLIRTEADGVSEEAIIEDLEFLQRQWESIQQEALSKRPPALLNRDDDFIQRVLRDVYSNDFNRIVTDSHTGLKRVKQHLMTWNGGRIPPGVLIDHHRDRVPLLEFFRVNAAVREALQPRVDLPSGGYIIIEPTEALTVIDVNSGSFTRSATARETVLWTNCEAAAEIARQLRLRNIAGVIIVDFIDMDSRRDQLQVLETFNKALSSDKARPQISQLSELGLVELTRKRQGQNLYELFGRPCATCGGLGHLVHLPGSTESAESLISEPVREPVVSSSRIYAPPAVRESSPDSLEPHPDLQELDLLNHPNYQESRGGRGSRRRRRREPLPTTGRINGKVESPVRNSAPAVPLEQPSQPPPVEGLPTSAIANRSSRSRNGRGDRKVMPPPETVTVEMTLEEQLVYSTMGVSPLVRNAQNVKDPKNTLIRVVLPGEVVQLSEIIAAETLLADSITEDELESPESFEVEAETENSFDQVEVIDAASVSSLDFEALPQPDVPDLDEQPAASDEEAAEEEVANARRRRRRRSSVSDADEASSIS
jgi:ribonuclease E